MQRGGTLAWRDPQVLRFQAIQNIVFGIVLGSLYSNLRFSQSQAYTLSMAIAIILGIVAMITIALGTAVAFSDKQVFVREQNDNMYSPVAHFFARLVVGLPISLVIAACLILPSYWWIGLKSGAAPFFFFFAVNLAMIFLFDGVVGVTAFLANDVTTAFGMGNFYEAISIFMSGIFIPYPLIPPFWVWLYYITPFSYAYSAAAINEFENTENEFWLFAIGITWLNKWGNLLVILLMGVLWRVLGLFLAIRVNKRATKNMKPKLE
jgi:ABC-type multidrug transport system permease subunit